MMRLIDADAYLQKIKKDPLYPLIERHGVEGTIEAMPTIDAEPIRHGHWIMLHKTHNVDEDNDYDWRCSECNHVDCHNINVEVPYCWHCGAKMDEVEE